MLIKDTGGDYTPAPEGLHRAVCCQVIDLGLQDGMYGEKRKVRIGFEIAAVRDDGKRHIVADNYTVSMNKKAALRKVLDQWFGIQAVQKKIDDEGGFDVAKLAGLPCMVNVVHSPSADGALTYANIGSVMRIQPGEQGLTPESDIWVYTADDRNRTVLEAMPEWLGDKVTTGIGKLDDQARQAAIQRGQPSGPHSDMDDEIPF